MTSVTQAFSAIRTLLESNTPQGLVLRWPNENALLPDDPQPFAFVDFQVRNGRLAGYGGGRGNNLYRNTARITIYVFVVKNVGLEASLTYAEALASVLRSYRDSSISCFDATVYPAGSASDLNPGSTSEDLGNYFYSVTEVSCHFDQVG